MLEELKEHEIDYSRAVNHMLTHCQMVQQDAEYAYAHKAIEKIARWFIQCDQGNTPKEGVKECLRVIRVRKGIPKYVMSALKTVDSEDAVEYARAFMSGMYMVVKCLHISKDYLYEYMNKGTLKRPLWGLTPEYKSSYKESTLRINNDGSAVVLAKSDITDWIYMGNHYQMLEMSDM